MTDRTQPPAGWFGERARPGPDGTRIDQPDPAGTGNQTGPHPDPAAGPNPQWATGPRPGPGTGPIPGPGTGSRAAARPGPRPGPGTGPIPVTNPGQNGRPAAGPRPGPAPGPQQHHEAWASNGSRPAASTARPGETPGGVPREADRPARGTIAGRDPDDQWAMFCYLGAIFSWLITPFGIYLLKRKSSLFIRQHAAQAFNLTATASLYAVSIAIVGALLALDSPKAALVLMLPVLVALWIAVMVYLVRAAGSAGRGEFYEIPNWVCVPMLR